MIDSPDNVVYPEGIMITTKHPPCALDTPEETLATLDLAAAGEARLRGNPYLTGTNVSCSADGPNLTLRGCLPNYYLWRLAQDLVGQLDGVAAVVNEIRVISPLRRHC